MVTIQDALKHAAPQPRAGFQTELADRLRHEFDDRRRSMRTGAGQRQTFRRVATVLVAVLVVGVGVVFAISTALQQVITNDEGLSAIYAQGYGHEIGISQTVDGYTVSVEWAYADGNRLTYAYIIQAPDGLYTNLNGDNRTVLREAISGEEIPMIQGMTGLVDSNGEFLQLGSEPVSNRSLSVFTSDLSSLDLQGQSTLDLHFEVGIYAVSAARRTQMPDASLNDMREPVTGVFTFDFSVPLINEQRLFNTPITSSDQNIDITLRRVIVSPSQVRAAVCFTPPAADRQWTALPRFTANGSEIAGGGSVRPVSGIGEAEGEICEESLYNAGMFDYTGGWRLEITELIGFGSGGGNDQQRISGLWGFDFTVP